MTKKQNLIRLSLGVLCLLIATYLGSSLYALYEQEILWQQQPLWFWLLAWGGFLLLWCKRYVRHEKSWKLVVASSLTGVLLAGGFMPMPTFFLLFIAFVPLLWAESQVAEAQEGTDQWTIFKLAFNAFFIWNLLSTWWIQNSSFVGGIIGNALNAVFMSIPIIFYHITKKHMGQRGANLGFIAYWMTFEIGHLTWDLSWPWLTLGNSFAHLPSLVQWYAYTGVFGGSLWVLWLNIALANRFLPIGTRVYPRKSLGTWIKPLLGVLVPLLVSIILYYQHDSTIGKQVEVVAVQPNYEPHYQKFRIPQREQLANFLALSKGQLTDKTAYLLFPETSFNGINAEELPNEQVIQRLRDFLKGYPNTQLVTGLSASLRYKENEPKPSHVFTYCNQEKTYCEYRDVHNAAVQLSGKEEKIPYYKKSKLVPGAEIMPFVGNISFFKNLILDLGGVPGVSLGRQEKRMAFESPNGVVGPLICYESIYGGYVTDYVKEGAEALFVITNDGWWGNTVGHRQHQYLASLRAIETRRYVVRSANTGVSCFINSRGDIYNETNYNEPIALRDNIHLREEQTFFVRYGNLLGRVSILISIWLLVSMLSNSLRGRNQEEV
ncbi:MAG: apolipoprotein N-acyltransferase [Aureispira sp.]